LPPLVFGVRMSTKYFMTLAVNENSIQSIDDLRSADSAVHF